MKTKEEKIIKHKYPELSNRQIKILLEQKCIDIDSQVNIKFNENSVRPLLVKLNYYPNIPIKYEGLNIKYEDKDTLVVFKATKISVEGNQNNPGLVNYVTWYINEKSINPFDIPRPVHRLDKETEGLIIFTKNIKAHQYYSKLFKKHDLTKRYKAKVIGKFNEYLMKNSLILPFTIQTYISNKPLNRKYFSTSKEQGKLAITIINNASHNKKSNISDLDIEIITGRTHQIRVHLSELGYPLIGDSIYTDISKQPSQELQLKAYSLEFKTKEGKDLKLTC